MAVTVPRVATRLLDARPASIAAPAERKGRRNAAIDMLRGGCIVMMITSHVSTSSWANTLSHPLRFVSGAEGFVFLSGLVVGMVYRRKIAAAGARAAYAAIWRRAAMIWLVHCVTVALAVASYLFLVRYPDFPDPRPLGFWRGAWLTATLQFQPGAVLNILPLYVLLLAIAPVAIEMLRRRRTLPLLAASLGVFVATQYYPTLGAWVHPSCGGDAFPLPAWQFVFFMGLIVGYHSRRIRDTVLAPHRRTLLISMAALCAVWAAVVWAQTPTFGLYDHERWDLFLWERHPLRFGRLMYFAVAIAAFYLLAQRVTAWRGAPARLSQWLVVLGRNSLYAFIVHLVVAMVSRALPGPWTSGAPAEILPIASVYLVYLMASRQIGRRWIPN